jgi:hypothetical protein
LWREEDEMGPVESNENVKFGFYLVAFIDILDQRASLRPLKDLPENETQREEFIQTIKSTFGAVDGIRKWFSSFYDEFVNSSKGLPTSLSEQQRKMYKKLKATDVKFQYFGDTIIMYVALDRELESKAINGIYAALLASGTTMLCSLAARRPLRGAIDVGFGGEMYKGEIYGSCLINAFDLESKVAQYPRIVVGENAISFLMYLMNRQVQEPKGLIPAYEKAMATSCLSMVTKDIDGYGIVDYLGSGFQNLIKRAKIEDDLVPKAFEFVQEQATRWQQEQNTELAFRYNLLRQYFAARL